MNPELSRRYRCFLTAALLALSSIDANAVRAAPAKMYPKDGYGVSFRYPADWVVQAEVPSYLPGPDVQVERPPVAGVMLGSGYRRTDFGGAAFTYSLRRGLSEAGCAGLLSPTGSAETKTVSSIVYRHSHVEDAAMMHQRSDDLYTTYDNGNCYVFDLVLLTSGYGARDGIRRMTESERATVMRQLYRILESVKFK